MKVIILKEFIEKIAQGELIEKVVISYNANYERSYQESYEEILKRFNIPLISKNVFGKVLSWQEGGEYLQFPISYRKGTTSYTEYRNPIKFMVWTSKKIIFPAYFSNGIEIVYISRNPSQKSEPFGVLTDNTHNGK